VLSQVDELQPVTVCSKVNTTHAASMLISGPDFQALEENGAVMTPCQWRDVPGIVVGSAVIIALLIIGALLPAI